MSARIIVHGEKNNVWIETKKTRDRFICMTTLPEKETNENPVHQNRGQQRQQTARDINGEKFNKATPYAAVIFHKRMLD
jgi:hypothetical protein